MKRENLSEEGWRGRRPAALVMALLLGPAAGLAHAQTSPAARAVPPPPPGDSDAEAVSEVVVRGRRPPQPGAVIGDIKPELQLSPSDIQSYGVSTVTELLDELAPETRSDRGRGGESPVVLLNGRRISGLNEIRDIPTEAILRVDILPEEVSLKYGYTANQRVVNIVLRRRFRAVTGEGRAGGATEGGQENGQAEADLLHIRGDNRLNLDLKYQQSSDLTEADRDVVSLASPTTPGGVDPGRYRTLLPATRSVSANGVLSRAIFGGISATGNATLGATTSDSEQGLPGAAAFAPATADIPAEATSGGIGPLRQSVDGWTAHLGSTLNRDVGKWRLSLTDAYDHADSFTRSDTGIDSAPQDKAQSRTDTANIQALGNGPLLPGPAGPLYASVKLGDTQSWLDSSSNRAGVFQGVDLVRNDFNAQLNLDLPLTGGKRHVLGWAGDLSLNLNAALDQVSDFGLLRTLGYGLNWTPIDGVTLIVSHTQDQAAPTVQQLGGPVIFTAGARILDFATGRTVDVTRIDGGSSGLIADERGVTKVGLTVKPVSGQDLTFSANYIDSRIKNPIVTFPAATAQIEAAFPERFTRDSGGNLIEVDDRPVNFAQQDRRELRWGFTYSRPVGPQPQARGRRRPRDAQAPDGPPLGADGRPPPPASPDASPGDRADASDGRGGGRGGGFGGGRGGFGGFGGGGAAGGRLQFAVYHTILFDDRMLVRPGGPELDLLNGAAAGSTGGQPRHEVEAQAGFTLKGIGARLSADWKSGTVVRAGPGSSTGDLSFSDLATVNVRVFDNLGQQASIVRDRPWLRGARVTLSLTNLFDSRIRVRDAAGLTPLSYQAAYLDPLGRTVTLSLRKLWY